jgi:hypothetical protein
MAHISGRVMEHDGVVGPCIRAAAKEQGRQADEPPSGAATSDGPQLNSGSDATGRPRPNDYRR